MEWVHANTYLHHVGCWIVALEQPDCEEEGPCTLLLGCKADILLQQPVPLWVMDARMRQQYNVEASQEDGLDQHNAFEKALVGAPSAKALVPIVKNELYLGVL